MLKPGDLVRYLGHTVRCGGRDCENVDLPFLIGKIVQVISTRADREDPGLMVNYGGYTYGFLERHVELVPVLGERYQAGFEAGMKRAAELADQLCSCDGLRFYDPQGVCASCGKKQGKIVEIIRRAIP